MKSTVAILLAIFLLFIMQIMGCSINEPPADEPTVHSLKALNVFPLNISEPSGLALNPDGKSLWTVSDRTNRIYHIDLSGNILKTLDYVGNDLEGIAFDSLQNVIFVVQERDREVVKLDLDGKELERRRILEGHDNSGLEGICIDGRHRFFTLKEKKPGLFIELNPDFSVKRKIELTFSGDNSGMWADTLLNRFWIVSDQDRSIYLWSPADGVLNRYKIPVIKPEGIAVDFAHGLAYIVSDAESKLYVFKLEL